MEHKKRLEKNIVLFYLLNLFTGLLFPVGIWVAFERRVLTFEQMALFSAFSTGVEMFLQIPTGAFADLLGRKLSLILGWLVISISYLYQAFATTPFMFFLSFFGIAVGTALSSGADVALVYDSLKILKREEEYPQIAAKMKLFYRLSIAAATVSGGFLYSMNIRLPYILESLAFLTALVFIFFMQETDLPTEQFSMNGYLLQMKQGFTELGKSSYTKTLVFYYTLVGSITWACLNYFNLPFMSSFGYSTVQLGIFTALAYAIVGIVIFLLTKSKNMMSRARIYLAFPIFMSIGLLPGLIANHYFAPLLLVIVLLTGSGRLTFLDAYVNQEFISKNRATALSALNMLVSIFYIILVTVGGRIQNAHGTKVIYTLLGLVTVIFVIPSAIQLIRQHRKYRQTAVVLELVEE